jgi:hypothetical protein
VVSPHHHRLWGNGFETSGDGDLELEVVIVFVVVVENYGFSTILKNYNYFIWT